MCKTVGVENVDELLNQTIPSHIRKYEAMDMHAEPVAESVALDQLREIMRENTPSTNFIGQGYYGTLVPGVIQRNLLENPAWYTAYTPYQAEISQGRLEALMVFQTLVCELTGMQVANASLLDEATAAAEAMAMMARWVNNAEKSTLFISDKVHPQTIDVVRTRAEFMGFSLVVGDAGAFDFTRTDLLGALVQYPDTSGRLVDYGAISAALKSTGAKLCVAADPLALVLCRPPGQWGADCVVGTMQRFGVPMWNGGPHAGYLATTAGNVRRMPGRLVGVSVDSHGAPAYRLTLQTREQHIRLDKATSNICTSQALLANMSAMFAVYHGPTGLTRIAQRVHSLAQLFVASLSPSAHLTPLHPTDYFDTVALRVAPMDASWLVDELARRRGLNVRLLSAPSEIAVAFDETHSEADVADLVAELRALEAEWVDGDAAVLPMGNEGRVAGDGLVPVLFRREGPLLPQSIFNTISTETEMMRYLYALQLKDLSLCTSMITLGSCTMKLNSVSSLLPCSWPEIANVHPFAPSWQVGGCRTLLHELRRLLCAVTGFDECSLQPMSGASGEYAGLLAIRKYYASIGQSERNVCIIPRSAHGTNSASAAMMGMSIAWIDDEAGMDLERLRDLCVSHAGRLAAMMITYPSTRGMFEEDIDEICQIVHEHGGNVYMDGANMNAQLGLTAPGWIGADVCHLNLHKTFSIPHGGGGPGLGPICVKSHLAPFLPGHAHEPTALPRTTGPVSGAPHGQAGIACVPWMFITMLGARGLTRSSTLAILNANYMATRLRPHFPMNHLNRHGRCSHEFIIDVSEIRAATGVTEEDIAKRLMDYGFHAPTMSWPVHHSLMIEPTESESKAELDRFCDALISIRAEIRRVESGEWDAKQNPLKNAPHTEKVVCGDEWPYPYSRTLAAFPAPWTAERGKFWPSVGRVSNSVGDKTLVLTLTQ